MNIRENILDCLDFAFRRDAEKGGDGSLSTREVADSAGVEISTARIALTGLAEDDAIIAFEGGLWRLIEAYDKSTPMRTADFHTPDCRCLRCAVDALRAHLVRMENEQGGLVTR